MALIHWRPWLDPFEDLEKDLWEDWRKFWPRTKELGGYMPKVDVYEKDNLVMVEAELPGIDPDKVDITVHDDVLTLKGETEKKTEVEEKGYYRKEVHCGSFYRQVSLPAHVRGESAEASYEKGVLKVTLPKVSEERGKKIEVKVKK